MNLQYLSINFLINFLYVMLKLMLTMNSAVGLYIFIGYSAILKLSLLCLFCQSGHKRVQPNLKIERRKQQII